MDAKTDNDAMSDDGDAGVMPSRVPMLRTADQYQAWRTRVANKCWALTGKDITLVQDDLCQKAMTAALESPTFDKLNWVGRCWLTITGSLHDELLNKVAHVTRGHIHSLLVEINAALTVNSAEEIQPLRLELYGVTMQKDCSSDLQTYIAYLMQRQKKLAVLGKPIDDDELISIFLKGLHPLFQPLQVHFAIPGSCPTKFDTLVGIVRKFSATPVVASELAKLKSGGVSQNMFPITTAPQQKPVCRLFSSKGSCRFGANCKFVHTATPTTQSTESKTGTLKCAFCYNKGHLATDCRKRIAQLNATSAVQVATATQHPMPSEEESPFGLMMLTQCSPHQIANWVLDSGATSNATFEESDCINVEDCDIKITAAGSTFTVKRKGTAFINALDEKGNVQPVTLSNCLISPLFPFRLLSLNCFTKRGHTVTFDKDGVRISNKINDVVLVGTAT
jgi:hypothetical protein